MSHVDRLTNQDLIQMYRTMLLTRTFEDVACGAWGKSDIVEVPHGSQGQEAIAVGTCYGLRQHDLVLPSLRGRGVFFARGVSARVQMAGLYAKVTGPARGKTAAHHMGDPEHGVILGSGLIGASITVATGAALGLKLQKTGDIVVDYFGDGAAQRGDFHESLNFAGVFKLPIIYVLENNGYAEYTPLRQHFGGDDFACRARGYGFPGVRLDGNDVFAVYEATQAAAARARTGEGPTLLECVTYRYRNHCEIEPPQAYRDPGEIEMWQAKDPLARLRASLVSRGVLDDALIVKMAAEVKAEVDDAVRFAEESPFPPATEVADDVYAAESSELVMGRRS